MTNMKDAVSGGSAHDPSQNFRKSICRQRGNRWESHTCMFLGFCFSVSCMRTRRLALVLDRVGEVGDDNKERPRCADR